MVDNLKVNLKNVKNEKEYEMKKVSDGKITIKLISNEEVKKLVKTSEHKCRTTCSCYGNCEKILTPWNEKKDIQCYSFIKEGIQIKNKEGKLEHLIVIDCKNCQKLKKPLRSKKYNEQKREKLMKNIMMDFFEADSVEKALANKKSWVDRKCLKENVNVIEGIKDEKVMSLLPMRKKDKKR